MTNPLLEDAILPAFSAIKHEHIKVAVEKQIAENRQHLKDLLLQVSKPDWDNFITPIAEQDDKLSKLWSPIGHMNAVVSNEPFRVEHDACLTLLADYSSEFGQNSDVYEAYQKVAANEQLTELQRKVIDDDLLDFRLAGVALDSKAKSRFREIQSRLAELGSQFSNNVLDATMAWSKHLSNKTALEGLPESALAVASACAKERGVDGFMLTLDIPCYMAVMTYATDAALRKEMYRAYCTRASDQQADGGHANWDNASLINETLALRHEMSLLLNFNNYAEYSVAKKMADDSEQVIGFLQQLATYSSQKAKQELQELSDFANQLDGKEQLDVWDIAFYSEKLRQQRYDISQEELRPWFPENQVLEGLFEITHRLYGVSITERMDVDKWHANVRFFDIFDADQQQVGSFYLDLYARSHKRGGAWMDSCRDRMLSSTAVLQLPVAYLTCNFNAPLGDAPALFTHDEVVTLFHEFGHGLHHLMSQINEIQVSGINGVAWDAVELPSQFMENFCYQKEALLLMARHAETKEPLSEQVLQKLNEARKFQAAMQMARQLEFSLFDFRLHLEYSADDKNLLSSVIQSVRDQVSVLQPPEWNRFANSFSHIFAGGYAAGYYSYKWAEVLSADVWSCFEEQGIFNKTVAEKFLQQILSQGGSKQAMELFVNFRGRKPSVDALLEQQGISKAS